MQVFIVYESEDDSDCVRGIFATRELAEIHFPEVLVTTSYYYVKPCEVVTS